MWQWSRATYSLPSQSFGIRISQTPAQKQSQELVETSQTVDDEPLLPMMYSFFEGMNSTRMRLHDIKLSI
jgi:hypothetical protein